jgi:serine/threonine protein phosphatase PrpC
MAIALTQSRLYLGRDLAEIETIQIAAGTACVYTHRAPGKNTDNEDAAGLIPCGENAGVILVADGLGGLPAGEHASGKVVSRLNEMVMNQCQVGISLREAILDGIEQANSELLDAGIGSAATIAVVEINGRDVRAYHAGDSMILITGQRGKIKYQSIPHSPVGYMVEAGLVPEDDAIYHEDRHLVSNAIGTAEMRVEIGPTLQLAKYDTLLVASDGLFDNLLVKEIVDIIRTGPLPAAAASLRTHCLDRMGPAIEERPHKPDDLGFILFRPNKG